MGVPWGWGGKGGGGDGVTAERLSGSRHPDMHPALPELPGGPSCSSGDSGGSGAEVGRTGGTGCPGAMVRGSHPWEGSTSPPLLPPPPPQTKGLKGWTQCCPLGWLRGHAVTSGMGAKLQSFPSPFPPPSPCLIAGGMLEGVGKDGVSISPP